MESDQPQSPKRVNPSSQPWQFNDAFDIVAAFLQNATSQYMTEGGKVATLTSKFASETARHVRKGARIAIEDGAAKTVA
ncbi:hypothetical protein FJ970_12390 [Mesorhizobium sp. B2-1-8]|uniref:hypothetical protein n=1 Tax=Mesorhizobium sp. B2-1-8 TaxID=2589967 RepID=UPI0015E2E170|nr:hypothetical protein [Mesorhizobium sp. B2-1-8]UCI21699.1 hypothetical protein FJ970_12390 [Mesorhizobium sp. B2-1-8]